MEDSPADDVTAGVSQIPVKAHFVVWQMVKQNGRPQEVATSRPLKRYIYRPRRACAVGLIGGGFVVGRLSCGWGAVPVTAFPAGDGGR
jgi:hypothetical protein